MIYGFSEIRDPFFGMRSLAFWSLCWVPVFTTPTTYGSQRACRCPSTGPDIFSLQHHGAVYCFPEDSSLGKLPLGARSMSPVRA